MVTMNLIAYFISVYVCYIRFYCSVDQNKNKQWYCSFIVEYLLCSLFFFTLSLLS